MDRTAINPLILYVFSFITVSLSSGLVYGYPHFRNNLLLNGTNLTESQLGIVYTVGSWTVHGGRFFSGMARDKFGTRIITFLSLLCASVGSIGLAVSDASDILQLSISFFFVGLGSGGQLCLQPVASLFPKKWQGTILASLSGAFQISGLVFLILVKITENRMYSYGSFVVILFCLAVCSLYLLPKDQFVPEIIMEKISNDDSSDHDGKEDGINLVSGDNENENKDMNNIHLQQEQDEGITVKTRSIDTIKTWEYFFLLFWFSVVLIPMQYYIGTIAFQMERKGDVDGTYINIFSICYALAAAASPIMGKCADLAGLGATQLIATLLIVFSLFILASSEAWWSLQVVGMACYGIGRMTVFGMYFTNIGKRFGYTHYGTLVGLGLLISALVSLLQYPLIYLADGGNEFEVNLISGFVIMFFGAPYCLWLALRERREQKIEGMGETLTGSEP